MTLLLFIVFAVLMLIGAPLGVALGLSGAVAIHFADLGMMSLPTSVYTGIAKYPLLAIPVFVLAGMVFERAGVALRLVADDTATLQTLDGGAAALASALEAANLKLTGLVIEPRAAQANAEVTSNA